MIAAYRAAYCRPGEVSVAEVEKPKPKDREILVKVHATTVNRTDCAIVSGKPWIMRLFTGLFKPKSPIPGTDFAGIVEEIGKGVTSFQIGDKVWGFNDQGLSSQAQCLVIREDGMIAQMPEKSSFEEAAASLEGAHYAINFINKVTLKPGQKALVNGATGAIGSALVQLLKNQQVFVTATCPTVQMELVKSIGADKVIDFTRTDFTLDDERYDFVMDAVGKSTFAQCRRLLTKKGIYISSELGPMVQNPFLALLTPLAGGKKVVFPVPSDIRTTLQTMKQLLEEGRFKPLIGRKYPLEQIRDAYEYVASGQKIGNVIVQVDR